LNAKASKDTILSKTFQITRKGSGFNDTSYSVIPVEDLPKTATPLSEFELIDVTEVLPEVPYAQQEAFYYKGLSATASVTGDAASSDTESASSVSTTESW
jgi:hypothetical protein